MYAVARLKEMTFIDSEEYLTPSNESKQNHFG